MVVVKNNFSEKSLLDFHYNAKLMLGSLPHIDSLNCVVNTKSLGINLSD